MVRSSEDEGSITDWVENETNSPGLDAMYDCLSNGGNASGTDTELIRAIKVGGRTILAAGGADGGIVQKYAEAISHDVAVLGTI